MSVCVQGNILEELLKLLKLEKIEENIFRGQSQDLGFGNVFGGQVLGQALSAASQTVPDERQAHSLHGYFMRAGDAAKPIVYTVDCIRDGKKLHHPAGGGRAEGPRYFFHGRFFPDRGTGF